MSIKKILDKYFKMENSNKYVKLEKSTSEEYFSLPLEKRTRKVWYWPRPWYKTPNGMAWSFDHFLFGEGSEWSKYYKQLVKEFPIQARLREFGEYEFKQLWFSFVVLKHRFKDNVYYPVRAIFKPQNRHLTKQIPRQWKSVDQILEDVLFAAFISYCELPIYVTIKWTDDPNLDEETNKYYRDQAEANLKVYNYIKLERQVLKNQIDKEWEGFSGSRRKDPETWNEKYKVVNDMEKNLLDQDTEALIYIVKNRQNWD